MVSLPASAAVVSAILGAGLGYSFYQLGSSLGVATADLLKTNASLYELSSNNPALQQELAAFATSGIDSLLVPIISRKVCKKIRARRDQSCIDAGIFDRNNGSWCLSLFDQ
ncbi:hypothetical protein NWO25_11755 [Enterococcus lactis]|nr:hypothetical protein [Enterococcus lactis]